MDEVEKTLKRNIMPVMPTILFGTFEMVTIAPPPVYVMDGVGKTLSQ
jgi:hypothetical protein